MRTNQFVINTKECTANYAKYFLMNKIEEEEKEQRKI
jgi:hypothetical protein